MPNVAAVAQYLEEFAPRRLAEEWDNVGLLVGDRRRKVARLMTCLTVTPSSAAEAVAEKADLIVTHHPLPFRALKRITSDTPEGRMLWDLIGARVAIYSPHTAFDSAARHQPASGRGTWLARHPAARSRGPSRQRRPGQPRRGPFGPIRQTADIGRLARGAKRFLGLPRAQLVGDPSRKVKSLAVACGSAGEFLEPARRAGCDCLLTGETRFHTCLEAEARRIGLLLVGHYASERFGVEALAETLAGQFTDIQCWASQRESDPLQWA